MSTQVTKHYTAVHHFVIRGSSWKIEVEKFVKVEYAGKRSAMKRFFAIDKKSDIYMAFYDK